MIRPRILIEAATILADMHNGKMKTRALSVVQGEEMELNDARLTGVGNYSCRQHVELLAEYLTIKRKEQTSCT